MIHLARRRDLSAGAAIAAIGAVAVLEGRTHGIGTLVRMGTGYFPIVLGVILILLGIAIAAGAMLGTAAVAGAHDVGAHDGAEPPDWRGCLSILAGTVAFIVLGEYAGLAPATFALVFVSALGDRQSTWRGAFVLACVLTLMAVVVFWYLLQVQFPVWRFGGA